MDVRAVWGEPGGGLRFAEFGPGHGQADLAQLVTVATRPVCRKVSVQLSRVIFSYNHADWYVKQVLALAARYR